MIPICWMMHSDPYVSERINDFMLRSNGMRVLNERTWKRGIPNIGRTGTHVARFGSGCLRLLDDYPLLEMEMPTGEWPAPDFFNINLLIFVSARMREALQLADDFVQYLQLKLVAAGPSAQAQDYRLLRVFPHQPAIDLGRSRYDVGTWIDDEGIRQEMVLAAESFALRQDLVPRADLFWADEMPARLLATDALAERVMKAGCTGVQFDDPATTGVLNGMIRIRTADGVAERVVG